MIYFVVIIVVKVEKRK